MDSYSQGNSSIIQVLLHVLHLEKIRHHDFIELQFDLYMCLMFGGCTKKKKEPCHLRGLFSQMGCHCTQGIHDLVLLLTVL